MDLQLYIEGDRYIEWKFSILYWRRWVYWMEILNFILKTMGILDVHSQYYIKGDGYIGWTFSILY